MIRIFIVVIIYVTCTKWAPCGAGAMTIVLVCSARECKRKRLEFSDNKTV